MEIIIGLVILGGIAWFFFIRDEKKSNEVVTDATTNVTAPYKVPEPAATTPIPLVVTNSKPEDNVPVAKKAPKAKAPAKPKAPKA